MSDMRDVLGRDILPFVSKPGRYIGGEFGAVVKAEADVRIALAFPDVYEIGMSHLGLRIVYSLVNERPGLAAERVFAPWPDMEARMRERGVALYGLETLRPLRGFDLVGFTLPHELTYTNILTMLELGGIPLLSRDRTGEPLPLVIAGGPGAFCPGPLEPFVDLFAAGDGEEALPEIMEIVREWKRAGGGNRSELLIRLARGVEGAYVPALYRDRRDAEGRVVGRDPAAEGVPLRVRRRVLARLSSSRWLSSFPVPHIEAVHDRVALEVRRGCGQGCRFCQAGFIYRPVRDEPPDDVIAAAEAALRKTGHHEVALCALSVGDVPGLEEMVRRVLEIRGPGPVSVSLPSLRPDRLSASLADRLAAGNRPGITLAPEAGTEAMRRRINKRIRFDELLRFTAVLRSRGWRAVKLYFMIGLPGETEEDIGAVAEAVERVASIGGKGRWDVNVTVSAFVPKAHTPFQWDPMDPPERLREKQALLRRSVRRRNVALKFHGVESSFLEAVFARGDARLAGVLLGAWRAGARFDGWRETFDAERWRTAFREAGVDPSAYAQRTFGAGEWLPWEVIDAGVSRAYLRAERERAERGEPTGDCSEACRGCGLCHPGGAAARPGGAAPPNCD